MIYLFKHYHFLLSPESRSYHCTLVPYICIDFFHICLFFLFIYSSFIFSFLIRLCLYPLIKSPILEIETKTTSPFRDKESQCKDGDLASTQTVAGMGLFNTQRTMPGPGEVLSDCSWKLGRNKGGREIPGT